MVSSTNDSWKVNTHHFYVEGFFALLAKPFICRSSDESRPLPNKLSAIWPSRCHDSCRLWARIHSQLFVKSRGVQNGLWSPLWNLQLLAHNLPGATCFSLIVINTAILWAPKGIIGPTLLHRICLLRNTPCNEPSYSTPAKSVLHPYGAMKRKRPASSFHLVRFLCRILRLTMTPLWYLWN